MNIVKDRTFEVPIPKVIEGVKETVSNLLREFQYLGEDGKFKNIPEYPEFAWFEGLVNAVTHRDYSFAGDYIRISMYDDRLEIFSPGKLPHFVTLDNMRTTRFSRNPSIARTLGNLGWVRELNEGVKRIYDEIQNFFLNDPTFSEPNKSSVLLTLENSITSRVLRRQDSLAERLSQETMATLSEYEITAVQCVYGKGRVSSRELATLIGRGNRTASAALKRLMAKGILQLHGTNLNDPSQYYTFTDISEE